VVGRLWAGNRRILGNSFVYIDKPLKLGDCKDTKIGFYKKHKENLKKNTSNKYFLRKFTSELNQRTEFYFLISIYITGFVSSFFD
jgi:hypothetical protein